MSEIANLADDGIEAIEQGDFEGAVEVLKEIKRADDADNVREIQPNYGTL